MGLGSVPGQSSQMSAVQIRDALQGLTGVNRLDATAVKSIPVTGLDPWQIITSDYTAIAGNRLRIDAAAGDIVITLPAIPLAIDPDIWIQRIDSSANSVLIRTGANKINGQSSKDGVFAPTSIQLIERFSYVNSVLGWLGQHDRMTYQNTPPTAGDLFFASVVFLMIPTGSNNSTVFSDSSSYASTVTTDGDTKIIGNTAIFDGSGDRLRIPSSPSLAMLGQDFCFELEIETNQTTAFTCFISRGTSAFGPGSWAVLLSPTGKLAIYWADFSASIPIMTSTTSVNDGVLRHIAWDRNGSTHRLFVDGVLESMITSTASMPDCLEQLVIGDDLNFSGRNYNGKNKVVRITSASRYTASFTPPTNYPTTI